jgi:hypothetical protein
MRTVTVGTLFEVVVVSTNSAFPPSNASDIDMEIPRKRSGDDTPRLSRLGYRLSVTLVDVLTLLLSSDCPFPKQLTDALDDSAEEDKHATKAAEEGRGIVKRAAAVRILDLAYSISSS